MNTNSHLSEKTTGLTKETIEKVQNCFAKHKGITEVILYGSRAKGNYQNGSDIDLCLVGESLNLNLLYKLSDDLDELMLPYTFDLSIKSKIENPDLVEHIDRVGKVFYTKKEANFS